MLTADLLRVRDNKTVIEPRYLNLDGKAAARYLNRAEAMIQIFRDHRGARRGEIEEAIADLIGDGTDFNLSRGIQKLLEDRSDFQTAAVTSPQDVREVVFALSAANHPVVAHTDALHTRRREDILAEAAATIQQRLEEEAGAPLPAPITPADIEEALYGDLNENQRLLSFKDIEAEDLLNRYNLALAQATLFRARELRITLQGASAAVHRPLFNYLKFYQLMHRVRRLSSGSWLLTIDGPSSLFQNTNRYGLQMAMFLPALLLCRDWTLEADLSWGPDRQDRTFTLDPAEGLVSHYRARGAYVTDEQAQLEERFEALGSDWTLTRDTGIYDVGGRDLLVPDLQFTHKHDGRTALMEIIGYWRRGALDSRARLLCDHGPPNLILAVSDRLKTDDGKKAIDLPITTLPFKGVILPKKVLELVEQVAS